MLNKDDVLGVIVTYNPDNKFINNVNQLLSQVSSVVIVDNGSTTNKPVKSKFQNPNRIHIIYNNKNLGIAKALNQGLKEAINRRYILYLTLDQDSYLLNRCVDEMLIILNENSEIASVGPNYLSRNRTTKYSFVDTLITSGNLTYTKIAEEIGGYTSKLFIDAVDFDFSLSIKNYGKKLALASNAFMSHELGEERTIRFFNKSFDLRLHSPLRHYYMFRNHKYILKKYGKSNPKFCNKKRIGMLIYFFEVLCFFPNKADNLKMIRKGLKDASKDKYGEFSR